MTTRILAREHLDHPRSRTAFRSVKLLVGCYLGISVLTVAHMCDYREASARSNTRFLS